jgi:hypothetical protein
MHKRRSGFWYKYNGKSYTLIQNLRFRPLRERPWTDAWLSADCANSGLKFGMLKYGLFE